MIKKSIGSHKIIKPDSFQISLIIGALEDGGVTLEEPGQIEIPWSLNYPTMPEKSWEVHEDISDQLDEADKLLHYFKKAPHSK